MITDVPDSAASDLPTRAYVRRRKLACERFLTFSFPWAVSLEKRVDILEKDIDDGSLDAVLDTFFEDIDAFFQTDGQSVIAIVPEQ